MGKFRILEKHPIPDPEGNGDTDTYTDSAWIDRGEVTAGNRYQARHAFASKSGKPEITLVAVSSSDWVEDTLRNEQRMVTVSSKPPKKRKVRQKAAAG